MLFSYLFWAGIIIKRKESNSGDVRLSKEKQKTGEEVKVTSNHTIEELNRMLDEIGGKAGEQEAKKLDIERSKRMMNRLNSFSEECEQCAQYLTEIENKTEQLANQTGPFPEEELKAYKQSFAAIHSHLEKEHKLVAKGFYQSIYLFIGVGAGVPFGLLIFDNIGLGIAIGLSLGVAVGAGLDADAKKKGLTL